MNIKHAFILASVACLGLCPLLVAGEPAPQKQSLTIPITLPAGRSVECVVPCGPSVPISALAFSPDGKTLATGGYQEVLLWDLAAGKLSKRLAAAELGESIRALVFLPDGKSLAVGHGTPGSSGAVKILNVETGQATASLEEPKDVVHCLALSPDGKLLAACGADVQAYVWNLDDKKLAATIKGHAGWVLGVSFSPDGKFLATAGADKTLRVWATEDWKPAVDFVQKEAVHGGAFSADGKILVAAVNGPGSRGVLLRRTDNVRYTRSFYMPGGSPMDVLWDTKKNRIYVPCTDGTVKVFDSNGRLVATYSGHQDWVYDVALSADGTRLASGSADGTVKVWNTADGKLLATLVQLAPRTEDWLVITARGYLATSSAGALAWKATNLKTPIEEITAILDKPELVQKAIAGEKTDPPALQ